MTNQVPFIPAAAARLIGDEALDGNHKLTDDGERLDPDTELDDGESSDSEETVDEDVREADDVNGNIEK